MGLRRRNTPEEFRPVSLEPVMGQRYTPPLDGHATSLNDYGDADRGHVGGAPGPVEIVMDAGFRDVILTTMKKAEAAKRQDRINERLQKLGIPTEGDTATPPIASAQPYPSLAKAEVPVDFIESLRRLRSGQGTSVQPRSYDVPSASTPPLNRQLLAGFDGPKSDVQSPPKPGGIGGGEQERLSTASSGDRSAATKKNLPDWLKGSPEEDDTMAVGANGVSSAGAMLDTPTAKDKRLGNRAKDWYAQASPKRRMGAIAVAGVILFGGLVGVGKVAGSSDGEATPRTAAELALATKQHPPISISAIADNCSGSVAPSALIPITYGGTATLQKTFAKGENTGHLIDKATDHVSAHESATYVGSSLNTTICPQPQDNTSASAKTGPTIAYNARTGKYTVNRADFITVPANVMPLGEQDCTSDKLARLCLTGPTEWSFNNIAPAVFDATTAKRANSAFATVGKGKNATKLTYSATARQQIAKSLVTPKPMLSTLEGIDKSEQCNQQLLAAADATIKNFVIDYANKHNQQSVSAKNVVFAKDSVYGSLSKAYNAAYSRTDSTRKAFKDAPSDIAITDFNPTCSVVVPAVATPKTPPNASATPGQDKE